MSALSKAGFKPTTSGAFRTRSSHMKHARQGLLALCFVSVAGLIAVVSASPRVEVKQLFNNGKLYKAEPPKK